MGSEEAREKILEGVNESRRAFLKKIILGSAFAVPAVASFSMSGLSPAEANPGLSNQSGRDFGLNIAETASGGRFPP